MQPKRLDKTCWRTVFTQVPDTVRDEKEKKDSVKRLRKCCELIYGRRMRMKKDWQGEKTQKQKCWCSGELAMDGEMDVYVPEEKRS
jgi:hypothetical protein